MSEEKADKILDILSDMKVNVAKNTVDLAHHIKRTELLEAGQSRLSNQQEKMIKLLYVGAGIGIALFGPEVLKVLKVLL